MPKASGKCAVYILLVIASATMLFPVVSMVCNSFMSGGEVEEAYALLSGDAQMEAGEEKSLSIRLIPERVSLMQYYQALFRKPTFLVMF